MTKRELNSKMAKISTYVSGKRFYAKYVQNASVSDMVRLNKYISANKYHFEYDGFRYTLTPYLKADKNGLTEYSADLRYSLSSNTTL